MAMWLDITDDVKVEGFNCSSESSLTDREWDFWPFILFSLWEENVYLFKLKETPKVTDTLGMLVPPLSEDRETHVAIF
jgi:hypothetical protein